MNRFGFSASVFFMSAAVGGCPLDAPIIPDSGYPPVAGRAPSSGGGGSRASSGGRGGNGGDGADIDAIRKQIDASGRGISLPDPPDDKTLCSFRFSMEEHMFAGTSFDEVKRLLVAQASEAQSKSEAGLQYRFRDGTGMSLRFTWRHKFCNSPAYPPHDNACKLSGENVPDDYYLESGDRQGAPYPRCWPHTDPSRE